MPHPANTLDAQVRADVLRTLAETGTPFGAIGHLLDPQLVDSDIERAALEWEQLRDAVHQIASIDGCDLDYDDGCLTGRWQSREDYEDHLNGRADDALAVLLYGLPPRCRACVRERPTEAHLWAPARAGDALCARHRDRLGAAVPDPWQTAAATS